MTTTDSRLRILKSTATTGAASAATYVLMLARLKVVAVLLGPSGVGLAGMYQAIMSFAAIAAGLGLNQSGVRQIAEAKASDDAESVTQVRAALWRASALLGIIGLLFIVSCRQSISRWVFGDASQEDAIAVLGLGVLALVISGSQFALLQGLRRIEDMARVSIAGGFVGSAVGIIAVWLYGIQGILAQVVVVPIATLAAGTWYAARVPRHHRRTSLTGQWEQTRIMLRLGVVLLSTGVLASLSLLLVRSLLLRTLGMDAVGHFQASWTVATTSLGFILGAMAADFYPHLTATVRLRGNINRLVNDQIQLALLMATPAVMLALLFAPVVMSALYSSSFDAATPLLRWQLVGDVLKIASWPLGFIILARGLGGVYFGIELAWNGIFLALVFLLLNAAGVVAPGMAYLAAYVLYFILLNFVVACLADFRWQHDTLRLIAVSLIASATVSWLSSQPSVLALGLAGIVTVSFAVYSARTLLAVLPPGRAASIAGRVPFLGRLLRGPRRD